MRANYMFLNRKNCAINVAQTELNTSLFAVIVASRVSRRLI
jgi:hypothetical protein